jgi:F0F1-type ATP synthase assembly protein I
MTAGDAPTHGGDQRSLVTASRYMALGLEFAGIVVAGVLAGYYIDTQLGTEPLFTLLLTLGGMGGAVYRLLWSLKRSNSQSHNGG